MEPRHQTSFDVALKLTVNYMTEEGERITTLFVYIGKRQNQYVAAVRI